MRETVCLYMFLSMCVLCVHVREREREWDKKERKKTGESFKFLFPFIKTRQLRTKSLFSSPGCSNPATTVVGDNCVQFFSNAGINPTKPGVNQKLFFLSHQLLN